jgi:ABC-2 type transport system ATP-binding protein
LIEIKSLTKTFGDKTVLSDLSLSFPRSGVFGICGPKDSGKTVLLDILAGVSPASAGEILFDGNNLTAAQIRKKLCIGYMSEYAPLIDEMTPYEFLEFIGEAKKIPDEKLYRQIGELFELVDINEIKDKPIITLSKPQKKFISFAQTLLGNPSLIILDEPFAGMSSAEVSSLKSIIKMLGAIKCVLIASRSANELEDICNEITVLAEEVAEIEVTEETEATEEKEDNE